MKFNFTFMRCLTVLMICLTAFSLQAQSDATVTITAPASVAGDYPAVQSVFGPGLTADISGAIVEGVDTAGLTTVCDSIGNDLTGAIALVDRGACGFVQKVQNAQAKGAIAVIVCNNNATFPYQAIPMGGDDMGTITIPAVMISYSDCQTIRAELANGLATTITGTGITHETGETCADPIVITDPGVYTIDSLAGGFGSVTNGAVNTQWYSFTPATDTLITVSSCGLTDEDTQLWILGGECEALFLYAINDDADAANNLFCSELTWAGTAGTEYLIYWTDAWSYQGFDWELTLAELPTADITVTVDVSQETVDPDGIFVAGTFNGFSNQEMVDNGDGTWSYTITGVTALDTVVYKFKNGPDGWEDNLNPQGCGIGGFGDRFVVGGIDDINVPAVCFNSCEACPPPSCTDPDAIICDDFEGYTVDDISAQSANWIPWGGTAGAADDATVSTDFAASGTQSLLVSAANGDDMLLLLGDSTSGNYLLSWKMYIPSGSAGYFNTQKVQDTPAAEFGMQAVLGTDGSITLDAGGGDVVPDATWTADTWMTFDMYVDLNNDWITFRIDGMEIYSWPASWQAFAQEGMLQLGAVNFYGNTDVVQYIDDVLYKTLPDCPEDAVICESYEGYPVDATTGGLAPFWTTWSGDFGTAEDGIVSDVVAFDGNNSMLIGDNEATDVLLLLGNQSEGNWRIEMQVYIPTGKVGYYNIQESETPAVAWNLDVFFNSDDNSNYTAGMGQLATGETFSHPEDAWFPVVSMIDLDNNTHTLMIDGNVVLDNADYDGNIGSLDFFSITGDHTAYYDAIRFIQLEPVAVPVDVTFNVNMMNEVVAADGAFIAGEFNGWTGEAMTDDGDGTWSFTTQLTAGDTIEYKFQNGEGGWEGDFLSDECGLNNNRFVVVGDMATDLDLVCFNSCIDCVVSAEDLVFQNSIKVFPNPASDLTNISFDFAETNNITIELVNKLGQRISFTELNNIQSANHELSVSDLATGMYFIHITNGEASMVEKLFVE